MPKRIQRKRTKGWKMPENTVYVGRPTMWGNPYEFDAKDEWNVVEGRKTAVMRFISWLAVPAGEHMKQWNYIQNHLKDLQGKDLACWCPLDQPCHADILLARANGSFAHIME